MPIPVLSSELVGEFERAFAGPITSLTATYRQAMLDSMRILSRVEYSIAQRSRALDLLRQYDAILDRAKDETAAWARSNLPEAYRLGRGFTDHGLERAQADAARAGVAMRMQTGFAKVHRAAVASAVGSMLNATNAALEKVGRRVNDVFRREGLQAVAKGIAEGKSRVQVSREIAQKLRDSGQAYFTDKLGRRWDLDVYAKMVARTSTREAATQGSINRCLEMGIELMEVSAHPCDDWCVYYEGVVVNVGSEDDPDYPGLDAIEGGPPFHPNCDHVLVPFVRELATKRELEAGKMDPEVAKASPRELQERYRREHPQQSRMAGRRAHAQARQAPSQALAATVEPRPAAARPPWAEPRAPRVPAAETVYAKVPRSEFPVAVDLSKGDYMAKAEIGEALRLTSVSGEVTTGVFEKGVAKGVRDGVMRELSALTPGERVGIQEVVVLKRQGYTFTAGGKTCRAGGYYDGWRQRIVLYDCGTDVKTPVAEMRVLLADKLDTLQHEVGHAQFTQAHGMWREQGSGAAARAVHRFEAAWEKFDGVTPYSEAWSAEGVRCETFAELRELIARGYPVDIEHVSKELLDAYRELAAVARSRTEWLGAGSLSQGAAKGTLLPKASQAGIRTSPNLLGEKLYVAPGVTARARERALAAVAKFPEEVQTRLTAFNLQASTGPIVNVGGRSGIVLGETYQGRVVTLYSGFRDDTALHELGHVYQPIWTNAPEGSLKADAWKAFADAHANQGLRIGEMGRATNLPQESFAEALTMRANGSWPSELTGSLREAMETAWSEAM